MRYLKLIAAVLAMSTLSACVGFIVPVPVSSNTTTTEDNERR